MFKCKGVKKGISLLLICSILLVNIPIRAEREKSEESVTILEEEISLRGEYEKHFRNSDGSYTAVSYSEPVHSKKNGKWEEIDNTLITRTNGNGSTLKNKDGIIDVVFANDNTEDFLVKITKDKYTISWSIEAEEIYDSSVNFNASIATVISEAKKGIDKVKVYDMKGKKNAKVKEKDLTNYDRNERKVIAKKLKSSVVYENLFNNNVNIEYSISSGKLKENIVLNEPSSINSYIMNLSVEGVIPKLNEDNSIVFYNAKNEEIFIIPSPFMMDSNDAYSSDIKVELEEINNNYILKLTPSREWLMDSERQYPLIIDPIVSPGNTRTNVQDTYVKKGSVDNCNTSGLMYVGLKNGILHRSYIKYNAFPIINGVIENAMMYITATDNTTTYGPLELYKVNSNWTSSTITWNNQPTNVSKIYRGTINKNNVYFTVTDVVKEWYRTNNQGQNNNYGFSIRYANEDYVDYNNFYTSESSDTSDRPFLRIIYNYYGCKSVRTIPPTAPIATVNCQGYAFFLDGQNLFPQFTEEDSKRCEQSTIDEALTLVRTRMRTWLNANFGIGNWREQDKCPSSVGTDEWVVCMRVGQGWNGKTKFDYHFWYRANNGDWYNKHGYYNASVRATTDSNPSTANNSSGWSYDTIIGYYSSDTVYYIVKE